MKSHINARFRHAFRELPEDIRQQARDAYKQFLQDPYYPKIRVSLQTPHPRILRMLPLSHASGGEGQKRDWNISIFSSQTRLSFKLLNFPH